VTDRTVERVEVVEPDPAWAERGAQLCRELALALAPWLVREPVHVGSTAVPGLPAEPVLDVQAAVADLAAAGAVAAALAPAGWRLVPPGLDGLGDRRLFVRVADGHRAAQLLLTTPDSPRWAERLAFRDALRADPDLADAYATLRRFLAEHGPGDRAAYTAGKASFVAAVLSGGADPAGR